MRYYLDSPTLFIRGSFRAASTGINGGICSVSTLLLQNTGEDGENADPEKELDNSAARAGIGRDYFGLLTTVPAGLVCVLQYDFITVFIVAGIHRNKPVSAGAVHIIISSSEGMTDAALLETIMVASEAKVEALLAQGVPLSGSASDGVITASEGKEQHRSAGRLSDVGRRVREAVLHGVPEALDRNETGMDFNSPAFFIYSRIKGEHWIAWSPDHCPYYPCHFEGQSCDFCYCPFYPCRNEELGQWAESSGGGRVWNCAGCTLLHDPALANYLKRYPGASQKELVRQAGLKKA